MTKPAIPRYGSQEPVELDIDVDEHGDRIRATRERQAHAKVARRWRDTLHGILVHARRYREGMDIDELSKSVLAESFGIRDAEARQAIMTALPGIIDAWDVGRAAQTIDELADSFAAAWPKGIDDDAEGEGPGELAARIERV